MKIQEINKDDRPRERALKYGVHVLNNSELFALIIGSGTKRQNAIELSNKIIFQGLEKAVGSKIKDLLKIKGIGIAKACKIAAIFEIMKRYNTKKSLAKKITCSNDVYEYIRLKIQNLEKEVFVVIYLDTKNKIISDEIVSVGILNASIVHPREVFQNAIRNNCNSIILSHNHPSGDIEPSNEDEEVTKNLVDCGKLLGITILDHIIVGHENYFSFKDSNLI